MKIIFAGTPQLATPSLMALIRSRHEVALVITQPDRAAGRGRKPHSPPVKDVALANAVPVIQPDTINRPEALERIREADPDAMLVIAYGKRLLKKALALPPLGCLNVHFSLLPKYRGAAPINHAILNGEAETGITVQRMDRRIDTGPVFVQHKTTIGEHETAGELADRLATLSAETIVLTLDGIASGALMVRPQDNADACDAPKLEKSDGVVRWEASAANIYNFTLGMTPWPGAFTFLHGASGSKGGRLILLDTRPFPDAGVSTEADAKPGTVVRADDALVVATGEGFLSIARVKPEGGRPMDATAWLRGHSVRVGDCFNATL